MRLTTFWVAGSLATLTVRLPLSGPSGPSVEGQDGGLARQVRAIAGHATATMQQRYSSVSDAEKRRGLAKVITLAGITAQVVIPVVIEGDTAPSTATPK